MDDLELLKEYLGYYQNLEKKSSLKENLLLFLAIGLILVLIHFVLDRIFFFNSAIRLYTRIILAAYLLFFLFKSCRDLYFWEKISFEKLALFLEKRLPSFQNHLINAYQLSFSKTGYPTSFIKKLREKAAKIVMKVDPSEALQLKKILLYKKILFFSILVFAIYLLITPILRQRGLANLPLFTKFAGIGKNSSEKTSIRKIVVIYQFPAYTKIKTKRKEGEFSEINALYGTKLTLNVIFSNPVKDASLLFSNGKIISDAGKSSQKRFDFIIKEPLLLQLKYYDFISGKYRKTEKKKVNVSFDSTPFLEFIKPGKDVDAKEDKTIPLQVQAVDDFGMKKLRFRYHSGKGEIARNDPVLYEVDLKNKRKVVVSATFKLPHNFSRVFAYYAECQDNAIPSPNIGRSSIYYIYPVSSPSIKAKQESEEQNLKGTLQILQKLEEELKDFLAEEKRIIAAAKKMEEIKDFTEDKNLDFLIESEQKWAELFQKMVNDLHKIGQQTKGKFTLADELVEMISHIESSAQNLKKKAITMAISESQIGLELAEEITSNLEKWLAEAPDNLKWDLEEPSKDYEVPEVELPDELEDIIGELIEQEEDMQEEIEDITSSWMDSLDKGAGWAVSDGPISNMSAKGITGNLMPNQQEIGGRSGEGRTGRSYGEMVEKTATGKGGRKTPARLTPDNLEPGQIQDTSGETPLGPTGGGKVSGWGPEGLRGEVQDLSFRYGLMAERQKKLIEKAEKLLRNLKILNIYNPQLEKSISAMKKFQIQLQEGRYQNLLKTKQVVVSQLKEVRQNLAKRTIVKVENSKVPGKRRNLGSVWEEKIPTGYEEIVTKYLRLSLGK